MKNNKTVKAVTVQRDYGQTEVVLNGKIPLGNKSVQQVKDLLKNRLHVQHVGLVEKNEKTESLIFDTCAVSKLTNTKLKKRINRFLPRLPQLLQ